MALVGELERAEPGEKKGSSQKATNTTSPITSLSESFE